jgi:hypothetical protein
MTLFAAENLHADIVAGLHSLGYRDEFLEENYKFPDYFKPSKEERQIPIAAFGETPVSYESALIGVAYANGLREQSLVNKYRAFGAPILLEVDKSVVREWAVSRNENAHHLVETYEASQIRQMFVRRAQNWERQSFMRDKNIGSFNWTRQLSLFAGLLPELEERIQETLEPLLHDALSAAKRVYRDSKGQTPDPAHLFKLVFWILTAKVFHDRRVNGFVSLSSDPDEILSAVAARYKEDVPRLLNKEARAVVVSRIWTELDFRHLSVEVLSQMWASMLLDREVKKRLGIHRTSRTIVRYMVERIPFQPPSDDKRIVLEPCSGSAVFLIGAMHKLRQNLFGMTPAERHRYFTKHLVGIEKEPFGVEISKLALTLADFPNPGGWTIKTGDVFEQSVLTNDLQRAGVVLCNPPFQAFTPSERTQYHLTSIHKPAELLHRVLNDLHPNGVIGFVLPRNVVDGRGGYAEIRKRLAERFANIELTVLPDKAFKAADAETALLIATEPIPHDSCRVLNRKVHDNDEAWARFELQHQISTEAEAHLSVAEAVRGFAAPELGEVWSFLINHPTLGEVAELHRGIEWRLPLTKNGAETGHRSILVRNSWSEDYELGVAPQTTFNVFEKPEMFYLSLRREDQRGGAYKHLWERPKAILNKSARSRGHWRIAAFPDNEGVVCYQTFIGVWPKSDKYDEWLLSAVLNSPVANAFVATREGKTDITKETLQLIPMPHFTEAQKDQLRSLINRYQRVIASPADKKPLDDPTRLLMEIDALVLDGYRMPPRLEYQLLSFFNGHGQDRPTSHDFGNYLPLDCDVYFPLSEHLSPEFKAATVGELLKRVEAS